MMEFFPQVRQAVRCVTVLIPSNEPCTAQPQIVHVQDPVKPQHKHTPQAGEAETRSTAHALKDYSGPPHWDTKHHEMPQDWQEQLENRRHEAALETTFISLYPPFPFLTLGCIPQESQPGSAGSLMESSTTRVARGIFFSIFCNTVKWMWQIS